MGTNYSLYKIPTWEELENIKSSIDEGNLIEAKRMMPDEIHIGKASNGWEFTFNHNNWQYFDKSKKSLKDFVSQCKIIDEYGQVISHDEFWKMVESKKGGLNSERYAELWDEIHPNQPKPYYMTSGRPTEIEVDGLRFSTSTKFC